MSLSEYDQICIDSCDRPDDECGSYQARGCAYLVATRHNQNVRNYMPKGYKQNTAGVKEQPLWDQSDNMTKFSVNVAAYSEPWIDRERAIYKRAGL